MRKAVLVEVFNEYAIHFFCSGRSIAFDAYSPQETAGAVLTGQIYKGICCKEGKFAGLEGIFYSTNCKSTAFEDAGIICRSYTELKNNEPALDNVFRLKVLSVAGIEYGAWHLTAGGKSILVCSALADKEISAILEHVEGKIECVFMSSQAFCGGKSIAALAQKGVDHIFVHGSSRPDTAEENSRIQKRINKLVKKGIAVRLINSFPSGMII